MGARGIGSFIDGAFRGYSFASQVKDGKEDRKRRDRLDKLAEKDRTRRNRREDQRDEWAQQDQTYQVGERNRVATERQDLKDVYTTAGEMTDEAMSAPRGTMPPVVGGSGDDALAGDAGLDVLGVSSKSPRDPAGRPITADPARGAMSQIGAAMEAKVAALVQDPAIQVTAARTGMDPDAYVRSLQPQAIEQNYQRVMQGRTGPQPVAGPSQSDLDLRALSEGRNEAVGVGQVPGTMPGPDVRRAPRGAMGPVDRIPPPRAGQPLTLAGQAAPDQMPAGISNLPSSPMTDAPMPSPGYEAIPGAPQGYRAQPNERPDMQSAPDAALTRGATTGLPMPTTTGAAPAVDTSPGATPATPATKQEVEQIAADTRKVLSDTALPSNDALSDAIEGAPKTPPRGTLEGERMRRADQVAGSWMEEYAKTGAPYVAEQLARRGMLAEAKDYQAWIESEDTKRGMESYGRAAYFASQGDMEGFGDSVMDLYNNEGYFGDGMTLVKDQSQFEKDDQGNITGAEVVFRDGDGNEFVQRWETMDEMVMDALNMLNPEKAFETRIEQMGKAAEIRTDAVEREADFADFVRKAMVTAGLKGNDVKRVADTAAALAKENIGGWPPNEDSTPMTEQQKMDAVIARIAAEDAAAAQIGAAPANVPQAPPEPMRRPG